MVKASINGKNRLVTQLRSVVVVFCMAFASHSATATDVPLPLIQDSDINLHKLGDGTLKWFGFSIYDAALWTENHSVVNDLFSKPLLLSITYKKNISSQNLVATTKSQWQELGIDSESKHSNWLDQLAQIWPDVKKGDVIASIVWPDGKTSFYSDTEYLGTISDPAFGPNFFAIWLSPDTTNPKLRRQLLGITSI